MKKTMILLCVLLFTMTTQAQELVTGGQFMDLLLPMEGNVAATESDWGTSDGENTNPKYAGTWEGTLGRWKDNGIEDVTRSYWGGNIIKGSDDKYHIYVSGWLESEANGHMAWSSKSRVYHAISDNVWGPYEYVSDIGPGHNSEIYKTGDTYVIYHIEPLGIYTSMTLGDTWTSGEFLYDQRGRILIAGENTETSLSNCSFAKREDGSFVMIDRGGGIWVSQNGLTDPWHQLTDKSVYLNNEITNRGTLEDPVIWRDHLQYHMIVNDWNARYAYYYRSLDGLHWTKEAGKAYTGTDPFAKHANGDVEKWHKYERPRVYQDAQGRAIRMNFAVIDCVKQSDLGNDTHSSKNINMPLTKQLLLEVQNISSTSATVQVKAEEGFNPKTDLNFSSLKFGSHDKVNYGNGFSYSSYTESGSDIIITFTGTDSGITTGEWAPKMLGTKTNGSIAFGYAKMPGVDYKPAMLSAVVPTIAQDGTVQSISLSNYGQSAATEGTIVRVYNQAGNTLLAHGTTTALAAYGSETVSLTKDAVASSGYTSIQVHFYATDGTTLLNTENIPLTEINKAQNELQTLIDEASALVNDPRMTSGTTALQTAIDNATAAEACYSLTAINTQKVTLNEALNTFKYANASPTNGQSITIPNATCDNLTDGWTLARLEANNALGWKMSSKGGSYDGFDGNFIEAYKGTGLGVANSAKQTLENMPAGRYRLRAWVIANGTGVTLYAGSNTTTCSSPTQPTEYMIGFSLNEAQGLEIGLDIASTTSAKWVAFDNWSLKYFGTAEGDIVEGAGNTPILGVNPNKVYRIKHLNTQRNRYMAATPNANGYLLTTNDNAQKGEFSLLPVLGRQGYYYIYNTEGYFVTPSTTNWTLSRTTPAEVLVTLNNGNRGSVDGSGDNNIYLLGESSQHANPQKKNDVELVYAYSAHDTDKGNNWILEEVSNATATLSLTQVTTAIESLVNSADAEDVPLSYTATVGSAGFGTVVVPFDADVTGDVEAWELTSVNGDSRIQGTKVTEVKVNKPVLLKNEGTLTLTSKSGTIAYDVAPVNGLLHGIHASGIVAAGNYVLQNQSGSVAFYKVESGSEPTITPFHAYLSTPASARMLVFDFGETTTIETVGQMPSAVSQSYDLQGRVTGNRRLGITIIRMSDGSVRKVMR